MFWLQKSQGIAWWGRNKRWFSCRVFLSYLTNNPARVIQIFLQASGAGTDCRHDCPGDSHLHAELEMRARESITNFLWLASVAAALPSLRQDGGQGWNREELRTQGAITASGPGCKTWRTEGEKHKLESPPEISAITGTSRAGREGMGAAALQMYLPPAPIPQPALERHLVGPAPNHQGKGLFPTLNRALVFGWYRIMAKQVTASLSGPEAWRDLESGVFLISCTKAWKLCEDALPCHSDHDDINHANKEGGVGRLQPETILCQSGRNDDLHRWANTQLLQSNKFCLFAIQAAICILFVRKVLKTYDHHDGRRCGWQHCYLTPSAHP